MKGKLSTIVAIVMILGLLAAACAPAAPEAVDGEDPPAEDAPAEPAGGVDAEDAPAEDPPAEQTSEGQRFLDAFGEKGGVWFAQGKTFEEAQQLHVADLEARAKALADENGQLKKSLAAARGEAEPVEFVADGEKPTADSEQDKQLDQNLGPNLSRVAKGFKKAPS